MALELTGSTIVKPAPVSSARLMALAEPPTALALATITEAPVVTSGGTVVVVGSVAIDPSVVESGAVVVVVRLFTR